MSPLPPGQGQDAEAPAEAEGLRIPPKIVRAVLLGGAGFGALVVLLGIIGGIMKLVDVNAREAADREAGAVVYEELAQTRATADKLLSGYAVVDAEKGVYRMPIDKAITAVVKDPELLKAPREKPKQVEGKAGADAAAGKAGPADPEKAVAATLGEKAAATDPEQAETAKAETAKSETAKAETAKAETAKADVPAKASVPAGGVPKAGAPERDPAKE